MTRLKLYAAKWAWTMWYLVIWIAIVVTLLLVEVHNG